MKNFTYSTIDGKTMIVINGTEKTILLDESGTEIWKLICEEKTKKQLKEILFSKYVGYEKQIDKDVDEFFELILNEGIKL